ncbi:hypothetical protein [uncultured Lacinutrix sp.]|uniref:hypothetical protein n=1 Tax=uncultured Lacinutrix sp. TaxID=574032 RepID=UPI00262CF33B|nr:hypothetical protein [uncultured Lacinutrix sp.]
MRRVLFFFFLFSLSSCQYFDAKKIDSETILEEELKTFNWNEVDTYPTFSSCDANQTKADKKACFENTLSQHILENLETETIIVSKDIKDTIVLEFQISETGELTLIHIKLDEITKQEIPNIEVLLTESLNTLPQIFPAIKRDQPVKTEFNLPVIINVN